MIFLKLFVNFNNSTILNLQNLFFVHLVVVTIGGSLISVFFATNRYIYNSLVARVLTNKICLMYL